MLRGAGLSRAAAAALVHPGYLSGRWYGQEFNTQNQVSYTVAVNTLYATPLCFKRPVTLDRLGLRLTTGAVGNCRLGLYTMETPIQPGNLISEIVTDFSTAATPANIEAAFTGPNPTLAPGWYFGALCFDAAPAVSSFAANTVAAGGLLNMIGATGAVHVLVNSTAPQARISRVAALTYVPTSAFFPSTFGTAQVAETNVGSPLMAWRAA